MAITGSCHCGDSHFRIEGRLPPALTRCTCSFCSKRGMLWAYYAPQQFQVVAHGHDAVYRWQSEQVAHHFCSRCGCTTYSDTPDFQPDGSWDGVTRRIGVNARLFDGFDAALHGVVVIDGRNLW